MKYEWVDILDIIHSFHSDLEQDHLQWNLKHNGHFFVKSLYQFISFREVQELNTVHLWHLKIPPKIRLFMWLLAKNKILTKSNIVNRGWTGSLQCHFCNLTKIVYHLFLQCHKARQVLFWPGNCQHFIVDWQGDNILHFVWLWLPKKLRTSFYYV